ncbi:hypothetical protein BDR26DRAFT_862192 [Obelidium mucronatum]|nr:hypothetical protein BDR26DRAFT_862192 [Obelidium mucronatum]
MLSITGLCLVAAEAVNVALTWSKDRMPLLPVYTYWVCLLIPLIGWAFSILVLHPWKVVRDGHSILEGAKPTVRGEIIQAKALFSNPGLWTLGACAALMSYYNGTTLSFSPVSLNSTFTDSVRMMSLLRLIYQVTYILGAWIISLAFLDNTNHTRSKRARMTSAMLIVFLMAVLVGTYIKTVTAYASYSLYGLFDGFTHTFFVWLLACFSNNPLKQARYVGFLYAIYYLTSAIKFALTENVEAIVSYDKFICIGMVVLALIMYGTFNFKYVTDTCVDDEDDVEEEVEFKTNVVESIQLEPGVSESGKVERYNEKEVLASAAKKVAFADSR